MFCQCSEKNNQMSEAPFLKINGRRGTHEHFSINVFIRVAYDGKACVRKTNNEWNKVLLYTEISCG